MSQWWQSALDVATTRQDYGWFVVALGWLALIAVVHAVPVPAAVRKWRLWWWVVAVGGLGAAVLEMARHATPQPGLVSTPVPGWDVALVLMQMGGPGVLGWLLCGQVRAQAWVRYVVAAVVIGATGLRLAAPWLARVEKNRVMIEQGPLPWVSSVVLALMAGGFAWWAIRCWRKEAALAPMRRRLEWAVLITVLLPVISSNGVLAEVAGRSRRWAAGDMNWTVVPTIALTVLLVWALGLAWWRAREPEFGAQVRAAMDRRDMRWTLRVVGLWLIAGLALAEWAGWASRARFEGTLLASARLATRLLDPAVMARCLGPELTLGETAQRRQPSGVTVPLFVSPHVRDAVFDGPRSLLPVIRQDAGVRYVVVTTLRDGWVVAPLYEQPPNFRGAVVAVQRAVGETDRRDWERRTAVIDGPFVNAWGALVGARAPLLGPDGAMLGWLGLYVGASEWASSQAQARMLSFAVVGLSAGLTLLLAVRRMQAAEKTAAVTAAALATAADRAKTAFLAQVSHELRTPIQGILGYGEMLERTPLTAPQRTQLRSLRSNGELLIRLVNDLLDLSALQVGSFRLAPGRASLAELVRLTVDSLRPRAQRKGLELSANIAPGVPPWLEFDATRVRQILLNLVGNAIKFTARGRVDVTLACGSVAADGRITCGLTVADTGPGIAPENQQRIFEPFQRLDATASEEGAGLGLTLSAALCRNMGGDLTVESDGQTGSRFVVTLPLLRGDAPDQSERRQSGETLVGKRVLVAEDNTLVRELFVAFLTEQGANCEAVSDGLAALDRCAEIPFDALVLDLSMPWADGDEVARRLLVGGSGLMRPGRIVGVSAHARGEERERALAAGIDVFLSKPVDLGVLAAAVGGPARARPAEGASGELRRRLEQQFERELEGLLAELEQAHAASDWEALRRRNHYLKNSADVVRDEALQAACTALEDALAATAPDGVAECWRRVRSQALARRAGSPG